MNYQAMLIERLRNGGEVPALKLAQPQVWDLQNLHAQYPIEGSLHPRMRYAIMSDEESKPIVAGVAGGEAKWQGHSEAAAAAL